MRRKLPLGAGDLPPRVHGMQTREAGTRKPAPPWAGTGAGCSALVEKSVCPLSRLSWIMLRRRTGDMPNNRTPDLCRLFQIEYKPETNVHVDPPK